VTFKEKTDEENPAVNEREREREREREKGESENLEKTINPLPISSFSLPPPSPPLSQRHLAQNSRNVSYFKIFLNSDLHLRLVCCSKNKFVFIFSKILARFCGWVGGCWGVN
jgi:hypothetical protein